MQKHLNILKNNHLFAQEEIAIINSSTQIMNVEFAISTIKHQGQIPYGRIDHQVSVMTIITVPFKMSVKMATAWAPNTVVKHRIRNPVVYRIQSAMVMEHVEM